MTQIIWLPYTADKSTSGVLRLTADVIGRYNNNNAIPVAIFLKEFESHN